MTAEVLTTVTGGIMTITINRPDAKNACNRNVAVLIAAALDELDSNPEIRLALLTGANGTFCSGMDLKAFLRGESPILDGRGFGGLCEESPKKPLIAAIEGYALAGGFELAIACDLIVAAENAKFGLPEAKVGLIAAAGGLLRSPQQLPPRIAMELALTGNFMGAQRAYDLGLINQVVPAGTALEAALALGRTIAANGPLAVMLSKQVIQASQDWSSAEMFERQAPMLHAILASEDAKEGSRAFAEKRAPNWQGR